MHELDKNEKPVILVFNKIDAYVPMEITDEFGGTVTMGLEELKKTWMSKLPATKCIFISAQDKQNVDELKEVMYTEIKRIFGIRYPFNNYLY